MNSDNSKFDTLRSNHTLAHDGEIGTQGLIARLAEWDDRYGITLSDASPNRVMITLDSVPSDLDSFADDVYALCPDVVDQYFLSFSDLAEDNTNPSFAKCIQELDEADDSFGLEVMKRWVKLERTIPLWWD